MQSKTGFCLLLFVLASLSIGKQFPATAQNAQPNIILINLDDADAQMLSQDILDTYYPAIAELSRGAIRFTNAHATTPFCAPSRAALMRGQYAFSTGIKLNDPLSTLSNGFAGGYTEFLARDYQNDVLSVWMKNAGYRTIHIGKYHHRNFDHRVPPGWDDFVVNGGAKYYSTTRFTNRDDPKGVRYNTGPDNYIVDLDAADAVYFLNTHLTTNPDQPFFLYLATLAPHYPSGGDVTQMVKHEYVNYPVPPFPTPPGFNEADMSDKPEHLRGIPQFTKSQIDHLMTGFESRARAMKSVDDMLATVTAALPRAVLNDTWIFFTSDNGFQLGQHRLQAKHDPYDCTTRVPLIVKGPGTSTLEANHLLAHIDICPTILELAGASIPKHVDAKSFMPLLKDPTAFVESDWQTEIMIENWSQKNTTGIFTDFVYTGLRMYDSVYVNWANGESEFYELNSDPFQLENAYQFLEPFDKNDLAMRLGTFRTEVVDPITTITTPQLLQIIPRTIMLDGFCEDDKGVDKVLIAIRSSTTGRYWNGKAWQDELLEIMVDPVAPTQLVSQWRQEQTIIADTSNGLDCIVLSARCRDTGGQIADPTGSITLMLDSEDPVASYSRELKQGVEFWPGMIKVHGDYDDNLEVLGLEVTIVDLVTSYYWNGTTFQPNWHASDASQNNGRWAIDLDLPPGTYESLVRPFDVAGNAPNSESLFFSVIGPD